MLSHNVKLLLAFGILGTLAMAQSDRKPQPLQKQQRPAKTSPQTDVPAAKPTNGHLVRVETISVPSEMVTSLFPP